jgi:DNA-binding transcriptional MerR regulator
MWLIDYAEDFSTLKQSQIYTLIKKNILKPEKKSGVYYFSYTDIYVLRIFRILKREGLSHLNIENAYGYLVNLKEDEPLSAYVLFHDGNSVYTIENLHSYLINASKGGQLTLPDCIQVQAIGSELDALRQRMNQEKKELLHLADRSRGQGVELQALDAWLAS